MNIYKEKLEVFYKYFRFSEPRAKCNLKLLFFYLSHILFIVQFN